MILELRSGSQLVINQCLWTPGAFIAAGNMGGQGVIVDPLELDVVIAALTDIRGAIAAGTPPPQEKEAA